MTTATQQELALPPRATPREIEGEYEMLPIALIKVKDQVRKHFDEDAMRALADSIHENGVIQPIVVRWDTKENAYVLTAGERRLRASKMCNRTTIPAVIRNDLDEADAATLQFIENMQRANLSTQEVVNGVGGMVDNLGTAETSRRLSIDIATISRTAGVRKLWHPVRALIEDGKLDSVDIAHELAKLASLDEDAARGLVQAFYTPRPHNPAPPTRKEIRSVIESKRKAIEQAAEQKVQQAQIEIDRDNQRGYESTAGELKPETKPPQDLLGDRDIPPPESKAAKAEAKRLQADNSERQALISAANETAQRIALFAQKPLGIQARPNPQNDQPIWTIFGRDIHSSELLLDDDPVQVHVDNVTMVRLPGDANTLGEVRYKFTLELPPASETELMQLLAKLSTPAAQPAAPQGLLLRPDEQTVQDFITAFTEPREGERIKCDWLFAQYEKASKKAKREAVDEAEFSRVMSLLGHQKHRFASGRHYLDMGPKQ